MHGMSKIKYVPPKKDFVQTILGLQTDLHTDQTSEEEGRE